MKRVCRGDDEKGWAGLPVDILATIFNKLNDLWCLLLVWPLVCRSWSFASMDPTCWRVIDMRLYTYSVKLDKFSDETEWIRQLQSIAWSPYRSKYLELLKAVINRSGRHIFHLILPDNMFMHPRTLIYICQRTPRLKRVIIPAVKLSDDMDVDAFDEALGYLTELECMELIHLVSSSSDSERITGVINSIGKNCKNLKEFVFYGNIHSDQALAIATAIPKLKTLDLRFSNLSEPGLSILLDHCMQFECLDISHCNAVDEATAFPKYPPFITKRNSFDQDLISRATSVVDEFRYCCGGALDSCQLCGFSECSEEKMRDRLSYIWMLRDVPLTNEVYESLYVFPNFTPFYIFAVLTGTEGEFCSYVDAYRARRCEETVCQVDPYRMADLIFPRIDLVFPRALHMHRSPE